MAVKHATQIRFQEFGDASVLQLLEVELPGPGAGEVQIKHEAIGLNFIEVYQRTGLYPLPLPSTLGTEAAGVVTAVGADVKEVKEGDRVAYATGPVGAYSSARNMPVASVVKIPDAISFEQAASMMLKGLSSQYLLRRTFRVEAGQTIVFHAAAGGVGLIAGQWAKHLGARVIGIVSTPEKAALAKANGCAEALLSSTDWVKEVRNLTGGRGVPVVYDSVGKSTFTQSLDCLQPRGLMVSFGNASGPVDPMPLTMLAQRGALYITRPTLAAYTANRKELEESAAELFDVVTSGAIKIQIHQRFHLSEAGKAQDALTSRKTTGSTVLIPN